MTTVAAMICADGFVMGSDTKVVSGETDVKWSANKIEVAQLGESPLVVGGAGSLRHIRDALKWMGIDDLKQRLGIGASLNQFLSAVVEVEIPSFARDYQEKYHASLELEMIIGCIDADGKPRLVVVYPDGDYDHINDCVAIGSGSIFGEILLRKLYHPEIKVEFAKKLIGYILWEIQGIDNYSGEDMQIVCVGCDRKRQDASPTEVAAYKELPSLMRNSYDAIRKDLALIDIGSIEKAIDTMRKAIGASVEAASTKKKQVPKERS